MLIIDSHAHIFPYLGAGKEAGFSSAEEHLYYLQRGTHKHLYQPKRRRSDNAIVHEETLWDPNDPSPNGRYDVNFRVGEYGRYEWTKDGIDYYIQIMPPSLRNNTAPPGLLKTLMDYAGVDKAVLQCSNGYGRLNEWYSKVLKDFPGLFFPLASVDENKAYEDKEIEVLRNAILKLGLKGLWFRASAKSFDHEYDAFWSGVLSLRIPVFMFLFPDEATFFPLLRRLGEWKERYSELKCVIPQAFPIDLIRKQGKFVIPDDIKKIVLRHSILFELAYPISQGKDEDYPYPTTQAAVKALYDTFGPGKMVWGSDAPNVERYCTYSQSLNYLKDYCDFIPQEDMELILGKNLQAIFAREEKGEYL